MSVQTPYEVLIIDDILQPGTWAPMARDSLEATREFRVKLVRTWDEAQQAIAAQQFDIFAIDLQLQSGTNGDDVARILRNNGTWQPIILVTNDSSYLREEVAKFESILRLGPISFYDKDDGEVGVRELFRDAAFRVNPLRRAIRILTALGLADRPFVVNGKQYTFSDLLVASPEMDKITLTLMESFNALTLEEMRKRANANPND